MRRNYATFRLAALAELLGLHVLLVAGMNMIPERLRFKNYKLWMRATFALWWAVVFLVAGTYYSWYVQPSSAASPAAQTVAHSAVVRVTITNFKFDPKEVAVPVGGTVDWLDDTGRHTVKADDGSFDSGTMVASGHFQHKFDQAGTYPYYCLYHGSKGGHDMAGTVIVK